MKLITVDVKKETFDVAAVEGSSNSIQIHFKNTPDEWRDDSVGVFVLFAKGDKSQMFPINKETMTTDVLNNMLSVNTGFKVTVFAMNSDTENPYKYVFPPIWVEVRQGYECDVSSAPDRDNMDAICTLIQVLMSYDEAEAERKANEEEREKKIADFDAEFKEYKNTIHNGEEVYDANSSLSQSGKAVAQAVASIVNSAPETLNTLEELATALGNDPNFATTIMTLLGGKVDTGIFNRITEELQEDMVLHKSNQSNPHFVTKEQIGLGNVDNTSDKDKPVSDAVKEELGNKVDKVDGKGLSTNDFTDGEKKLLNNLPIKDLGVFILSLEDGGFDEDAYQRYNDTIDNLDSGIYTLKFMEAGFDVTEFYFVTKGKSAHGDYSSQIRFMDNSVLDDYAEHMAIDRRYYANGSWSGWETLSSNEIEALVYEINHRVGNLDNLNTVVTDNLVDAINEICRVMVYSAQIVYSVEEIQDEYMEIPTVETTMELINPTPITEKPTILEPNKAYNFGFVHNLSLSFPTYANDGDVIYITFFAEADEGTLPNLVIDTTNTCDIELIPENSTGYEIFAKYNGNASPFGIDNYWIVNYSEFTL